MSETRRKIDIFDTTLRDGEQSPGVNLGVREKLEIARQLATLGVDIIEAGFPVTSEGDAEAVRRIAGEIRGVTVCALARAVEKDMTIALECLKKAPRRRLHVFLATSEIHRKYKLRKAKDEIERIAVWAVKYAKKRIGEVEFSPEDASRTERDFLFRIIEKTIQAGATVINIPDTVGYTTPGEFRDLIEAIHDNVPNIRKAVVSVHCHDDLGLSVANSLAAVLGGARQVECTVNGVGERAGNAAMEEIVMAMDTRKDLYRFRTGIRKSAICETSRLVSKLTGMVVQPNKAIVGKNAFAHESGIHQHGVLAKRATYEIIRPQDVGFGESQLVLGKHSGRHAFANSARKLGYRLSKKDLDESFERFKRLSDKKKEVYEDDLRVVVESVELEDVKKEYELKFLKVVSETSKAPLAEIRLDRRGRTLSASGTGDGPVDAAYKTLDRLLGFKLKLLDYTIRSVTVGKDALGEVTVWVRSASGAEARGRFASTDVIEASVRAYLDAVNKIHFKRSKDKLPTV
ncbi:MAG: 2-isopropylmalate synthase [Candidatus Omnitrophica bacterium]|nr:2-isopropylmalate synthase [Candidatus Omnitrophota bacterium]